ncbi:MAG: lipoyl domain-containing protein [Candidatus Krumholzibacteriia bacterium]
MTVEVRVPTLGESITEVQVADWLRAVGDTVQVDEPLAEIDSDKATVELPSPVAGRIIELKVAAGAFCNVGDVVAVIDETAAGAPAPAPAADADTSAPAPAAPAAPAHHAGRPARPGRPGRRVDATAIRLFPAPAGAYREDAQRRRRATRATAWRPHHPPRPARGPAPARSA